MLSSVLPRATRQLQKSFHSASSRHVCAFTLIQLFILFHRPSRDSSYTLLVTRTHRRPPTMVEITPPSPTESTSVPAPQTKPAKSPKANPKQPLPANAKAGEGKTKSAKELKKEKRAAAVAARPEGAAVAGGPEGAGSGSAAGGAGGRPISSQQVPTDGRPISGLIQTASSPNVPSASIPNPAGPSSAPRRPAAPGPAPDSTHLTSVLAQQQNSFFSHLPQQEAPDTAQALKTCKLHPIIVRLGVLMSSGQLRGANARTMGMMTAFREVIRDYECPDQAVLWKDLPIYLSPMIAWLETCRPKGVGGGNAIR